MDDCNHDKIDHRHKNSSQISLITFFLPLIKRVSFTQDFSENKNTEFPFTCVMIILQKSALLQGSLLPFSSLPFPSLFLSSNLKKVFALANLYFVTLFCFIVFLLSQTEQSNSNLKKCRLQKKKYEFYIAVVTEVPYIFFLFSHKISPAS